MLKFGMKRGVVRQGWLVFLLACGGIGQAAGVLGQNASLTQSPFCRRTDCQQVSNQHLSPELSSLVYVTLASREEQGYPRPGPTLELFRKGQVTVSARLVLVAQDTFFAQGDLKKPRSNTAIAASFLELLTGQPLPNFEVMRRWEHACEGGKTSRFAGLRLGCDTQNVSDATQYSLWVMP